MVFLRTTTITRTTVSKLNRHADGSLQRTVTVTTTTKTRITATATPDPPHATPPCSNALDVTQLPQEILRMIVANLPVNVYLNALGSAAPCFGSFMFTDIGFAWRHTNMFVNAADSLLECFQASNWALLPIPYQAAFLALISECHQPATTEFDYHPLTTWYLKCASPSVALTLSRLLASHGNLYGGINIHQPNFLNWAVTHGYSQVVRLLLQDTSFKIPGSSLTKACHFNHIDIVHILLADPRTDPNTRNCYVLKWAAERNRVDIVQLLLQNTRSTNVAHLNASLALAAFEGSTEAFVLLASDTRTDIHFDSECCLHRAVSSGHVDIVRFILLDPQTDLRVHYDSLFMTASRTGHAEMVRLLLSCASFSNNPLSSAQSEVHPMTIK
ncbi:hypothetical protein HDU77_007216 [Chytriomyces hyalinus]|nr:hypothetical protein HDU77_007216 [Chytriomyces hyalinus]